ncbi:MAG: DUF1674 domain-containing protein [Gammaproteobacteria bacterium]
MSGTGQTQQPTAADAPPVDSDAEECGHAVPSTPSAPREIGGAEGPDPTRYGDWERKGRCIDF